MHYLVYLPSLKVMMASLNEQDCKDAFKDVGRDFDEDYRVMDGSQFVKLFEPVLWKLASSHFDLSATEITSEEASDLLVRNGGGSYYIAASQVAAHRSGQIKLKDGMYLYYMPKEQP